MILPSFGETNDRPRRLYTMVGKPIVICATDIEEAMPNQVDENLDINLF